MRMGFVMGGILTIVIGVLLEFILLPIALTQFGTYNASLASYGTSVVNVNSAIPIFIALIPLFTVIGGAVAFLYGVVKSN